MGSGPWAVLDFRGPDDRPARETFRDPVEVVEARSLAQVRPALDRVESLARSGLTVVGFVAYDAAPGLEPKFEVRDGYEGPLVWFAGFRVDGSTGWRVGPVNPPTRQPEAWEPAFNADR